MLKSAPVLGWPAERMAARGEIMMIIMSSRARTEAEKLANGKAHLGLIKINGHSLRSRPFEFRLSLRGSLGLSVGRSVGLSGGRRARKLCPPPTLPASSAPARSLAPPVSIELTPMIDCQQLACSAAKAEAARKSRSERLVLEAAAT